MKNACALILVFIALSGHLPALAKIYSEDFSGELKLLPVSDQVKKVAFGSSGSTMPYITSNQFAGPVQNKDACIREQCLKVSGTRFARPHSSSWAVVVDSSSLKKGIYVVSFDVSQLDLRDSSFYFSLFEGDIGRGYIEIRTYRSKACRKISIQNEGARRNAKPLLEEVPIAGAGQMTLEFQIGRDLTPGSYLILSWTSDSPQAGVSVDATIDNIEVRPAGESGPITLG